MFQQHRCELQNSSWNANGFAGPFTAAKYETHVYLSRHNIAAITETKLGCRPGHPLPSHTVHFFPRFGPELVACSAFRLQPEHAAVRGHCYVYGMVDQAPSGFQFRSLAICNSLWAFVIYLLRDLFSCVPAAWMAGWKLLQKRPLLPTPTLRLYLLLGWIFVEKVGGLSSPALQDSSLPDRGSTYAAVDDYGRKLVGFCEQTGLMLRMGGRLATQQGSAAKQPGRGAARPAAWTMCSSPGVPFAVCGFALCPRAAPFAMIQTMNLSFSVRELVSQLVSQR